MEQCVPPYGRTLKKKEKRSNAQDDRIEMPDGKGTATKVSRWIREAESPLRIVQRESHANKINRSKALGLILCRIVAEQMRVRCIQRAFGTVIVAVAEISALQPRRASRTIPLCAKGMVRGDQHAKKQGHKHDQTFFPETDFPE